MISKFRFIPILLVVALAGIGMQASAADLKIGYVSVPDLLKQSPQAQRANDDMTKKFDSRKKDLMAEQDKIKNLQDQLSKNGAVMSQAQLQDTQGQLDELQRDFGRKSSDFQDDYNMERNAQLSKLQQDVLKAVQEFALAQKYNMIVSSEGVFYADNTVNVTDQVLAQMEKDYKAENAKSGN
ncbi:MAG TPA: OmpH family outer membrane protein [Gammaproteobacteria bacterium]|nr:OmpH family outer membrane protein [Gammaproteobacteria bacterium]